ncbi:MAG: carboxypeptidase regulatory-like domain-containing protein [Nitrospirae bacterium]|nr:carboxypeptidase regulatory-like domain-containing protein [Nitrospirota bacterium]
MKKVLLLFVLLTFVLSGIAFAGPYEVVDVKGGGSITGVVKAAAKVADPVVKIETTKPEEHQLCGMTAPSGMYEISAGMGVKNVLVYIEEVPKGKALPKMDYKLTNLKCQFTPLVGIAYSGSNFVVTNSDPVFHNTSIGLMVGGKRSTVYNLALPGKDQVITKPVRRTGLNSVKCDAHPWMRAWIYAAKNPYATITDADGKYEIKDLLPGTYKVTFFHEGFGDVTKDVTVAAGKPATLDHTFSKK